MGGPNASANDKTPDETSMTLRAAHMQRLLLPDHQMQGWQVLHLAPLAQDDGRIRCQRRLATCTHRWSLT